jgi:hypothetical protein
MAALIFNRVTELSAWKLLHDLTDHERWEAFHRTFIDYDDATMAAETERWNKMTRKGLKKDIRPKVNLEDGEMCAALFWNGNFSTKARKAC